MFIDPWQQIGLSVLGILDDYASQHLSVFRQVVATEQGDWRAACLAPGLQG